MLQSTPRRSTIIHKCFSQLGALSKSCGGDKLQLLVNAHKKKNNKRMTNTRRGRATTTERTQQIYAYTLIALQLCTSAWNDRLSRSADGDSGRLVTMAFDVCVYVCAHVASLWRRLKGKLKGWGGGQERKEMQRQTTHSCGTRFRFPVSLQENKCQGLLGKGAGILSPVSTYVAAGPGEAGTSSLSHSRLQLCWSYNCL